MKAAVLLEIADHLETLNRTEFDLGHWRYENCNTTGCAIGHSCGLKKVKRTGLKLRFDMEKQICKNNKTITVREFIPSFVDKNGNEELHFKAIATAFNITVYEAEYLFYPSMYRYGDKTQAKTVANRIRDFVAKKQANPKYEVPSRHF